MPRYCEICGGVLTRLEYNLDPENYILVCANDNCPKGWLGFRIQKLEQRVQDMDNALQALNTRLTGLLDQLEVHSNGKLSEVHKS